MELVTYYPSAISDFDRINMNRGTVGLGYKGTADTDLLDGTLSVSGTVRIGTGTVAPNPTSKLHIAGNESTIAGQDRAQIRLQDTGAGQQWTFNVFGSASQEGAGKFGINQVGSGNRFLIDTTGNVGIGTVTPLSGLHMEVPRWAYSFATGPIIGAVPNSNDSPGIQFFNDQGRLRGALGTSSSASGQWSRDAQPGDVVLRASPGRLLFVTDTLDITPSQAPSVNPGTAYPTRMLINTAGNVGIGTTTPTLHPSGLPGNLDANDAWIRAANGGLGRWASQLGGAKAMAKLRRNTFQTIPGSDAIVKINFDTEDFDTGGMGDPSNSRFVIQQTGVYLVTGSWWCAAAAGDDIYAYIYRNGAAIVAGGESVDIPFNNRPGYAVVTDVLALNSGDVIEMYVSQEDNSSDSTMTAIAFQPRMTVIRLD